MLFNSPVFLFLFLPVVLLAFFRIGGLGHHRVAIAWLVAASLFFYAWWNPAYLGLILFSMFFNYAVGIALSQQNSSGSSARKLLLIAGIAVNLGLLGYFKYANFFVDTLNLALGTDWNLHKILLPLAISFFTFQQIAYLVDAYYGETKEYNFLHYCLFVTFFPQLIAGPIVHHREMLPQFSQKRVYHFNPSDFSIGVTIFFIGLFKKIVIADSLALHVSPVFSAAEAGHELTFFAAWKGTIAYTLQLYFDFSGYSDMAIGLARMFGIRLPLNFHSPYQAVNIIDFWRRWHMTLSRFLRDYLYIPLGGNRKGRFRRHLNLLLTMLLGGLWHGAGWTFVAWGALHGFYLIANHAWHSLWKRPLDTWWSRVFARTLTLLAVMVAWVFFRAESFDGALNLLSAMGDLPSTLQGRIGPFEQWLGALGVSMNGGYLAAEHYGDFAWMLFWILVIWYVPNTQQWMGAVTPAVDAREEMLKPPLAIPGWKRLRWSENRLWGFIVGTIALTSILTMTKVSEFLYFQF